MGDTKLGQKCPRFVRYKQCEAHTQDAMGALSISKYLMGRQKGSQWLRYVPIAQLRRSGGKGGKGNSIFQKTLNISPFRRCAQKSRTYISTSRRGHQNGGNQEREKKRSLTPRFLVCYANALYCKPTAYRLMILLMAFRGSRVRYSRVRLGAENLVTGRVGLQSTHMSTPTRSPRIRLRNRFAHTKYIFDLNSSRTSGTCKKTSYK